MKQKVEVRISSLDAQNVINMIRNHDVKWETIRFCIKPKKGNWLYTISIKEFEEMIDKAISSASLDESYKP